jgi:hypothetical protein
MAARASNIASSSARCLPAPHNASSTYCWSGRSIASAVKGQPRPSGICGEGMQYWSSWPVNYHEIRERALRFGWQIGQDGDTPRGPFIYFLNEGHPGTVIEMAEATPVRLRIFDQVHKAALNWDGRDPIRINWPQG